MAARGVQRAQQGAARALFPILSPILLPSFSKANSREFSAQKNINIKGKSRCSSSLISSRLSVSRNILGGSCASAAAAGDRPCTSQAECRLLESCAPSGIAGQDMADSGEGAAKRCKMEVDLPSRSSDGGGPRGAAQRLQDLLEAKHEHDAAIAGIDECVAEGILSAAETAERRSLASRGATQQCPRMPTLSMEELSKYFKMPEKAVAKHLGICLTSLKKICRANGISRWPYRKVRSVL
jgi:hypothetical protein